MPVEFCFEDLENLIEYEIGKIRRMIPFGKLSVLYFSVPSLDEAEKVYKLLVTVLRESDAIFVKDTNFFLVLPLTDKEGAEFIYTAIEGFFDKKFPKVISCYPLDGENAEELLKQIIKNAKFNYEVELNDFFIKENF